jgi:hypothetical protein
MSAVHQRIVEASVRDLNKKLRLERPFARDIRGFLKELLREVKKEYLQSGNTLNVTIYTQDLAKVFLAHYNKVKSAFAGTGVVDLNKKALDSYGQDAFVNQVINNTLNDYFLVLAEEQARIVLKTVEKDLDSLIKSYISDSVLSGKNPDPQVIIDLVVNDYDAKIAGKANVISITETQYASELAKQVEFEQLAVQADPTSDLMYKVWSAILDSKTRPWHATADGQRVAINEPFIVKGEKLMYPGDTSFGVSADNIINCRCNSVLIKP